MSAAMAMVIFTRNLQRHVACPPTAASGRTVGEVLEAVFSANPTARGYVLDDQGMLRKHMVVFVDGRMIEDRQTLSDPVGPAGEISLTSGSAG